MDQPQNERRGKTISRLPLILSVHSPTAALGSLSSVALSSELATMNVTHPSSISAWFDGACWPNQGSDNHGSYGAIIRRGHQVILSRSVYLGRGPQLTSEVCEYAGIICVLHFLLAQNVQLATVFGDSQMVIQQLDGIARARRGVYLAQYRQAQDLRSRLPDVRLFWTSRKTNREADALSRMPIETLLQRRVRRR